MKSLLKNLALAAGGGIVGYVGDNVFGVLSTLHVPSSFHVPLALAIGGAIGHWFPKPNHQNDGGL